MKSDDLKNDPHYYYDEKVKELNEEIAQKIEERIQAGNEAAIQALKELAEWVPECGFPSNITPAYIAHGSTRPARDVPFCTEAYTYEVWGKDDARTFLSLLGGIAKALGFSSFHDFCIKKRLQE